MLGPTCYQWQSKLSSLIDRYYKVETRTNIRVKVLDVLTNVIQMNRYEKLHILSKIHYCILIKS